MFCKKIKCRGFGQGKFLQRTDIQLTFSSVEGQKFSSRLGVLSSMSIWIEKNKEKCYCLFTQLANL